MIIVYALLQLFVIGLAGATWFMAFELNPETLFGKIIVGMLTIPFSIFVLSIPFLVYLSTNSPDLATLKKATWECKSSHMATTYVMVGKVLVPVTDEVCDAYGRK